MGCQSETWVRNATLKSTSSVGCRLYPETLYWGRAPAARPRPPASRARRPQPRPRNHAAASVQQRRICTDVTVTIRQCSADTSPCTPLHRPVQRPVAQGRRKWGSGGAPRIPQNNIRVDTGQGKPGNQGKVREKNGQGNQGKVREIRREVRENFKSTVNRRAPRELSSAAALCLPRRRALLVLRLLRPAAAASTPSPLTFGKLWIHFL